jgi:hypothetical protein
MIRLVVLLGLSLTIEFIQVAPPDTQVSERNVAVFRAVVRAGLIPEPSVGDARVTLAERTSQSAGNLSDVAVCATDSEGSRVRMACATDGRRESVAHQNEEDRLGEQSKPLAVLF